MKLKSLNRKSLLATALEMLRSSILGGLQPGDSLPSEGELALRLGVSRTIIREAMRMLEARGLVEIRQGRPTRVRAGDTQAVTATLDVLLHQGKHGLLELTEVRRGLEGEACALAAQRATGQHIAAMEQAIESMRLANGELSAMIEADMRFHEILVECTGNIVFKVLLEPLTKLLCESRRQTLRQSGPEAAMAGHGRILEAVKRHSPADARRAMLEHLELVQSDIKEGV